MYCNYYCLWVLITVLGVVFQEQVLGRSTYHSKKLGADHHRKLHDYELIEYLVEHANQTIQVADLETVKFSSSYFTNRLANKRIVFIGDSITRYQYLALVYSLKTGHFLNISTFPNPVVERSWMSWDEFFAGTTRLLAPFEWCDCVRVGTNTAKHIENRYYFDNTNNISIVLSYTADSVSCKGHWQDWGDDDIWRKPLTTYVGPFWTMPFQDAVKWVKRDVFRMPSNGQFTGRGAAPDSFSESILVMNVGTRAHYFGNIDYVNQFLDAVKVANFTKFIWKTTTFKSRFVEKDYLFADPDRENKYYAHDALMCGLKEIICLNTSWTKHVNSSTLMWDSLHFHAPVYNHLNIQLMKLL